jgi:hypothetical protein
VVTKQRTEVPIRRASVTLIWRRSVRAFCVPISVQIGSYAPGGQYANGASIMVDSVAQPVDSSRAAGN